MKKGQKELVKLYKHLNYSDGGDFRNENLATFVVSKLKTGSLLDVGCGSGLVAVKANLNGHKRSLGCDIESELLKIARSNALKQKSKATFKKVSIFNLKKNLNSTFDNVTCLDVIEHLDDDKKALSQLFSVLKKNGRIIIVVPAHPFLYSKKDASIGHVRRYTFSEIKTKVNEAGFKIQNISYWNFLGFFAYFVSGKLMGNVVGESVRYKTKSAFKQLFQKGVFMWVKYIENQITFPIGLSLVVIATKK